MYVRCNIKKGTDDAADFETNYKSQVIKIEKILWNGVVFIKSEDYSTFKSRIDGNTIKWEDVMLREDSRNYELWLEV